MSEKKIEYNNPPLYKQGEQRVTAFARKGTSQ
jgi:hypothetical protein